MRKTLGRAELDLFGQVPVSFDEVLMWMLAVPKLPPTSPRFAAYVRDYNVPEKIRAAKLSARLAIQGDHGEAEMALTNTPGPWHVNDAGEVFGPDFGVAASTRIAKVEPRQAIGLSGPHENRLRAEANARLIAAAPTLLQALAQIRDAAHHGTARADFEVRQEIFQIAQRELVALGHTPYTDSPGEEARASGASER